MPPLDKFLSFNICLEVRDSVNFCYKARFQSIRNGKYRGIRLRPISICTCAVVQLTIDFTS
ncbi:hypothetical protein BK655_18730 [Pseudomonas brassicacearum]|nr:hypothetical protein BK655_18730 [Pseudomonas brassicacearum]